MDFGPIGGPVMPLSPMMEALSTPPFADASYPSTMAPQFGPGQLDFLNGMLSSVQSCRFPDFMPSFGDMFGGGNGGFMGQQQMMMMMLMMQQQQMMAMLMLLLLTRGGQGNLAYSPAQQAQPGPSGETPGQTPGVCPAGPSGASGSPYNSKANMGGKASDYDSYIQEAAETYGVDPNLIKAVIKQESDFNARAQSSCGAQGLMQLMPDTARGLGCSNAWDPRQNIMAGTRFLKQLLDRYHGNTQLALAAYNAGPGAVDKYGGVPPYNETQNYVSRIMHNYQSMTA
jgi:hypothetical protein